jgi:hypothetical protein
MNQVEDNISLKLNEIGLNFMGRINLAQGME